MPPIRKLGMRPARDICLINSRLARHEFCQSNCARSAPVPGAPYPHLQSQRDCVTQPRVARNELPWVKVTDNSQPQRGCGMVISPWSSATTLSGLLQCRVRFPRVARSSQPWALLRNPFGIQRSALSSIRASDGNSETRAWYRNRRW